MVGFAILVLPLGSVLQHLSSCNWFLAKAMIVQYHRRDRYIKGHFSREFSASGRRLEEDDLPLRPSRELRASSPRCRGSR